MPVARRPSFTGTSSLLVTLPSSLRASSTAPAFASRAIVTAPVALFALSLRPAGATIWIAPDSVATSTAAFACFTATLAAPPRTQSEPLAPSASTAPAIVCRRSAPSTFDATSLPTPSVSVRWRPAGTRTTMSAHASSPSPCVAIVMRRPAISGPNFPSPFTKTSVDATPAAG